MSNYKKTPMPC